MNDHMDDFYTRWGINMAGHVGAGWIGLMDSLVVDLIALGWDRKVGQIKEKFGGLRFYIDAPYDAEGEPLWTAEQYDAILERIAKAERESYGVCERCGEPGIPRTGSWIKTLCDTHAPGREPLRDPWFDKLMLPDAMMEEPGL